MPRSGGATSPALGDLGGFERGLQRASGLGMVPFVAQAVAVAALGHTLYPVWWFVGPAPVIFTAVVVTVVTCVRGRSRPQWRFAAAAVCAAGAVLTAVATSMTVTELGIATLPLVTALVTMLGLLDRPRIAVPAGLVLIAAQMVAVASSRPLRPADVAVVTVINLVILVAATVAGLLVRRAADDQDRAHGRLVRALLADRAAAGALADRREQERELHDTVLSTLTALARGSLADSPRLRSQCAADARYLRALRRQSEPDDARDLLAELSRLAETMSTPHWRVNVDGSAAPVAPLAPHVIVGLVRAVREALTNAARHSGADAVEVRVGGGPGHVTVEVADAGAGASSAAGHGGLGVRRSIVERMADIGGSGSVTHRAGVGTTVVLTWPA